MRSQLIDRRDLQFLLHELLAVETLTQLPRFAEHSRETFDAAIDSALRIATERYAPHRQRSDSDEPRIEAGRVVLPPEVAPALRAFVDAGFLAATHDHEDGGMQLPRTVANACWALFKSANVATDTYATLTIGVANMVHAFGSAAQRARWLPPLLDGRHFGTMVLTEPQAGSSLAEIRASATPRADGRYIIRAQKIFITAGDHELSDNIVHLVLARLPDAPPGVKGLSLFIVPKRRDDGTPNDVALAGLIHKMGSRGTTSTMLNFGERGDCIGELLGPPHQGLACMFQMMNEARINVGISATMLAYAGYLHALAYARERMQGRATPDPRSPPVPIVRHADVRRMLLAQKVVAEGGLALCLHASLLADRAELDPDATERHQARLQLDLLTPVIKAWCSTQGVLANSLAIQVHGGYGYTREYPVEQLLRDNRLNSIHEGTDGIQALDLLGRKVGAEGGAALALLGTAMLRTVAETRALDDETLAAHATQLERAWHELAHTTATLLAALPAQPQLALANASVYLEAFGHTLVAWLWLRQAVIAQPHRNHPDDAEARFYRGKLAAARHFFSHELPRTAPQHTLLRSLDAGLVELDDTCL
ncbi:acyl-CoA dehydrogenase [Aquincola sp. S2]|uniref:Acyl-CoA dehydrogenase n=1 Tax=Pseudaquabacterium terrae TaxID=2732868 RepID=A0ABX2EJF9_9BURK|nr:acyl-CoA dehydrogenase [Aquabacterium terrae]NRF68716.1 acyl-CoA dehydrogenase [Aquabacterium terrae]